MDKKRLASHVEEIENLRDIIKHNLNGLQIHLDKIKKILNEPDVEPELKTQSQPQPSPIPLEKLKDRYLTARETSELTGIRLTTLGNQRSNRRGIPYIKAGGSIRYRMKDILAYMDEHRIVTEESRSRGRGRHR